LNGKLAYWRVHAINLPVVRLQCSALVWQTISYERWHLKKRFGKRKAGSTNTAAAKNFIAMGAHSVFRSII
jgi:hypothetical protein